MAQGIRKIGMMEQLGYRRRPKPSVPVRTPEEKATDRARADDFLRSMAPVWGVAPEHVDMWIDNPEAYRALNKIVDREARVAVEGDTDLNHDNVEAAE